MAQYASIADVEARTTRTFTAEEEAVMTALLQDAAALIDATGTKAGADAKRVVSCRMIIRAMGSGEDFGVPIGANQGSMAAGGYTQSWTLGGSGQVGELYLGKAERALLGLANAVGAYSAVQELVPQPEAQP